MALVLGRPSRRRASLIAFCAVAVAVVGVVTRSGQAHAAVTHTVSTSPLVTAVSRSTDKLDAFTVGTDNKIYTAAWDPSFSDGWHGWAQINGGVAAPNTSVYAVSRSTDKLDAFAVGGDLHVYTAAWEPSFADGWHGWWQLPGLTVAPGSSVHAVSPAPDRIALFAVGVDYGVYTTAWSPSTGWAGWSRLAGGTAAPHTNVYGVSRSQGEIDVFAVDSSHRIVTAAWDDASPGWRGWWQILGGVAAPNTSVYPVTRSADKLDIFAVGTDQRVYTAAWEPSFSDGWHGWTQINGGTVAPNTSVYGVSRGPDALDIFIVGTDNGSYTASWMPTFTDGWHGWWRIGDSATARGGTSVFAVSRSHDWLDIFRIDPDTGVYTASWNPAFTDGWHGWWQAADRTAIQYNTYAGIDGGTPVGGYITATFFSDGSYNFTGNLHDSGFPSYNTSAYVVLLADDDTAFATEHSGHVDGTSSLGGSRDDNWNTTGDNATLAWYWPSLSHHFRIAPPPNAHADWDFSGLLNELIQVYKTVKEVVPLF